MHAIWAFAVEGIEQADYMAASSVAIVFFAPAVSFAQVVEDSSLIGERRRAGDNEFKRDIAAGFICLLVVK